MHHRSRFIIRFASAAAALVASGARGAVLAAQSVPDTLPPVTVTVLRTPVDVPRAPFAVTAVGRHQATAARPGFALDEVLGGVAGVQVDDRLNFALGERISIRGIGAQSQFGVRGIRVIVDGIPATLPDGQTQLNNVDLSSLGGAEVIRGPASALYGNASGGVVTLRTAPAPAAPFAPVGEALYGSDGLLHLQAGAGGTHGRASYVVSADRLDYRGYRQFDRARNAHLNAVGTYAFDRGSVRLVLNGVQYDAQNPGSLSDSLIAVDRRQAFAGNVRQQTGERGKQLQVGASSALAFGPGELRLSAYTLRRGLTNPIPPRIIALERAVGGGRVAYAVQGGGPRRSVVAIAGAEAAVQRDDRRNWVNGGGARGALTLDQRERVTSASPFVQITGRAGPVTVLGGVRYDAFRFAAADHRVTPTDPNDSGVRRMSAVSPSVGASIELVPALRLYGNLATGFQTPTTTELANRPSGAGGFNPLLQPERIHSREIGVKGATPRVRYDLGVYDTRVDGELIPFQVASMPGRDYYRNAGTARHRGVDGELEIVAAPGVALRASYSVVDARYLTYTVGSASYAGRRVPGVAPRIATLGVDWRPRLLRGGFVAAEERIDAATPVNDANTAWSPGYVVTNLRGALPVGGVSVIGGVGNLLGATYNTSVVINAVGGRYYEPGAGRTGYVGVSLRLRGSSRR